LRVLKNDKRAIFSAAGHAERAAAFLHDLQSKTAAAAEPVTESMRAAAWDGHSAVRPPDELNWSAC